MLLTQEVGVLVMSRSEFNLQTGEEIELPDAEPSYILPTIEELRSRMVLTPAQARVKLANLGMLTGIDIAISALPVDNLTRIYWEYATEFKRNDLTLNEFCVNSLGMSPEQIDTLFVN